MNPRGYFATAVTLAAATALPFALFQALLMRAPIGSAIAVGIAFGVLFGLIMAIFIRGKTVQYRCANPGAMLEELPGALAEMGYHPESKFGNSMTFKPSFWAGWLSGRITITAQDNRIEVFGPRRYVRKLIGKLEHFTPTPQALHGSDKRQFEGASSGMSDEVANRLRSLQALLDQNLITEAEYAERRKTILSSV